LVTGGRVDRYRLHFLDNPVLGQDMTGRLAGHSFDEAGLHGDRH